MATMATTLLLSLPFKVKIFKMEAILKPLFINTCLACAQYIFSFETELLSTEMSGKLKF